MERRTLSWVGGELLYQISYEGGRERSGWQREQVRTVSTTRTRLGAAVQEAEGRPRPGVPQGSIPRGQEG